MAAAESSPPNQATSAALIFGRHVAGIMLVAVFNPGTLKIGSGFLWQQIALGSLGIGLAASLLAALFFTKTQGGAEILRNTARVAWVFCILQLIGVWVN